MKKIIIATLFTFSSLMSSFVFAGVQENKNVEELRIETVKNDNVQNSKSTHTESSKVESNVEKPQKIYQFDTLEEAQKFLAECTDLVVVTTQVKGETVILSTHESTVPCITRPEGTAIIYVISA